jgi:predicted unusual protein kinase regulating ubiquinone biosynthesis (AarF/ABC1/UbiB family)
MEQLGPTFVKLGQMLSTKEDLLPAAWTDELNRLYSQVAPVMQSPQTESEQSEISCWIRITAVRTAR